MRFWDSSAIVPLFLEQEGSERANALIRSDAEVAYWWATPVECAGAFARNRRDGVSDGATESLLLSRFEGARVGWLEVLPHEALRRRAGHLLRVHTLRAADAFQLAAALAWSDGSGGELVTFDTRLADAARLEGLSVPSM